MTGLKRKANVLLQYSELFGFIPVCEYQQSGIIVADIEAAFGDVQVPMSLLNDTTRKRLADTGLADTGLADTGLAVRGGSVQSSASASADAGGF